MLQKDRENHGRLSTVHDVAQSLRSRGYGLTTDKAFAMSAPERNDLHREIFGGELDRDDPNVHANRYRARDVFDYRRISKNRVHIERAQSIDLVDRNFSGRRSGRRIELADNGKIRHLVEQLLLIVPKAHQRAEGIFALNAFRTSTIVTEAQHRDHDEFVIIYVLAKWGSGASTQLSRDSNGRDIVCEHSLQPGEILIFNDAMFFHYTTPLRAVGQDSERDALVMTIGQQSAR